eukprot:14710623-Alexandrium_andersonii.AAC.2
MAPDEPAIAIAARVAEIDSLRVSSPLSAKTVPLAPRALPAPQVCALAQDCTSVHPHTVELHRAHQIYNFRKNGGGWSR